MTKLLLVPLDDIVVFPNMNVTLTVDVGDEDRVLLVPKHEGEFAAVGTVARVTDRVRLPGEAQIGRVAGGVGERPGVRDRADEGLDAPIVAAQLEDLLHDGAILRLELTCALVGGDAVLPLLDLDEQPALGVCLGRAGNTPVQALDRDGGGSARKADAVGHACDGADRCELALSLIHI